MDGVTHQHNLHYFPCIDIAIGISIADADAMPMAMANAADADAGIKKGSSLPRRK